ncbi:hypothetical protein Dimus_038922 [Dionaea muscipula]
MSPSRVERGVAWGTAAASAAGWARRWWLDSGCKRGGWRGLRGDDVDRRGCGHGRRKKKMEMMVVVAARRWWWWRPAMVVVAAGYGCSRQEGRLPWLLCLDDEHGELGF